jgi:two-component system, OmpR family, sensor kinase
MTAPPARLRTGSLRRRVLVSAVVVITVVLLLVIVATDVLFAAQSRRDTDTALRQRALLAEQLVRQQVAPRELLRRVRATGVDVRVTLPGGEELGDASVPAGLDQARRGLQRLGQTTVLQRSLSDGSRLLLVADGTERTAAQQRLRRLLVLVGLLALLVAVVALVLVTRVALAPLDDMAGVARAIARGDRGRRLAPTRTDTELGRAAGAFDEMVDALEGAERAARASEGRTRRFVADAAHELRTPIAGVQAAAEAVLQTTPAGAGAAVSGASAASAVAEQEERDRLHLLLVREARRAARLVEDLLSLARIDAGLELHRVPVDVMTLATAEAERTRLLAPGLDVVVRGEPVTALADPHRVAQVLANLLDNARRHTQDGGTVTVTVRAAGHWAEVSVADTGPGVPPADRERIFDRLVRLDASRSVHSGGAGLGLAIARGIARAHGGDLRCLDARGGLFVLVLPTAEHAPTVPTLSG